MVGHIRDTINQPCENKQSNKSVLRIHLMFGCDWLQHERGGKRQQDELKRKWVAYLLGCIDNALSDDIAFHDATCK